MSNDPEPDTRQRRIAGWPRRLARRLLMAAGTILLIQLTIGFTGLPGALTRWLAGGDPSTDRPRYVVVLGGGGIPSATGLMRTYCAAAFAAGQTGMTFIVALPSDGDPATNSVGRMRDELILRGIPADAILMETRGRNTHEQAVNIREMLASDIDTPVALVTSPYHVRRAILCFRKEGFTQVTGLPSAEVSAEADMGNGLAFRYGFWNNLISALEVLRELTALALYAMQGWL
jgi:uncharacterized SAM-binding protein YcdF (DUF218 family)